MPTPIELRLTEPAGFDDDVLPWALASATCGGIDACLGSDPER